MYHVLMSRLGNFCTVSKKDDPPEVFGTQFVAVGALVAEVRVMQAEFGNKGKPAAELVQDAIFRLLRKNDVK